MAGSASPPLTSLTMTAPAARAAAATRDRVVSMLTATAGPGELGDHGQDPPEFLLDLHAAGAGPRRLAAHVDVVGAGGRHVSPCATAAATVS